MTERIMHNVEELQKAVEFFGTITAMAKALDVHYVSARNWLNGTFLLSVENALRLQLITDNYVLAKDLRPDFEPFKYLTII